MRSVGVSPAAPEGAGRRVLGVDPGTVATGWGVVDDGGRDPLHIASGVVRPRGTRAERLAQIHRQVCELCEEFTPSAISLEKTFVGDNVQTAFRLGEARGAVMVAAAGLGLPVIEYSPAEIKLAIVGSGRAQKAQMQAMVTRLLGLSSPPTEDQADALGVALCHLQTSRFRSTVDRHLADPGLAARPTRRPTTAKRR